MPLLELRWSVFDVSDSCLVYKASGNEILKKFSLESGVHKIQRCPPTENRGRRHTSTITVVVLPFVSFDPKYQEQDFRIECQIGSGCGGQHRNKTMSAVRVTHIVSGLTAYIDGRCQHTNKKDAMAILISRLKDRDRNSHNSNVNVDRVSQMCNLNRGAKIRTYNFIEDRVKDERIDRKFRTKDIMNGKLELIYNEIKG